MHQQQMQHMQHTQHMQQQEMLAEMLAKQEQQRDAIAALQDQHEQEQALRQQGQVQVTLLREQMQGEVLQLQEHVRLLPGLDKYVVESDTPLQTCPSVPTTHQCYSLTFVEFPKLALQSTWQFYLAHALLNSHSQRSLHT